MSPAPARANDATVEVTYLTAPECHLCERGRVVLADLGERFSLQVREVDLHSAEGRDLVAQTRLPFPPAVVVDGRLLAHGRLSLRRLTRQLAALEASAALHETGRGD